MNEKKIRITHGIYRFARSIQFKCRNTETYLPLPVKFQKQLEMLYKIWWYVKIPVTRFGKTIYLSTVIDMPLEFTIAHELVRDITVISINHPSDTFKKKTGVKIVKQRMEWVLNNPKQRRVWKSSLLGDN